MIEHSRTIQERETDDRSTSCQGNRSLYSVRELEIEQRPSGSTFRPYSQYLSVMLLYVAIPKRDQMLRNFKVELSRDCHIQS